MGKEKKSSNRKDSVVFMNTAAMPVATIKDPSPFDKYYADMQAIYNETTESFHATDVRSTEIVQKAADWAKVSRAMIMANAALFGRFKGNYELREKALAGLDECKKDAGIRADNLKLHYELAAREKDPDPLYLRKLKDLHLNSLKFYFRADTTQLAYLDRYVNDPNYVTPELRAEKKWSAIAAEWMKKVPKGHDYLPARPFPPVRIPEGERVPDVPAPYAAWKNLPPEDFYYDTEHDELALPKGYVSKDQRIDDESVVWNWTDNTVTMKFRGGEAVTWPFWKPKDTYDMLKEGDWCAEYYIRLYEQILADMDPPGMHDV